jgi:capsular exopolysaccharide synthesis family protein
MKQEENINLIAIFHNFYRYKWSVISILVSTLVATFFYIKQLTPTYSSHILIGIGSYQKSSINSLFPNNYISRDTDKESLANHEIKILKSRHIISKVLDKIDLSKQFFIQQEWKKQELYKEQVPFKVTFKNKTFKKNSFNFILEELDKKSFTLIIQNSDDGTKKKIEKCQYGQLIQRKNYELKIDKKVLNYSLLGKKYQVKIEINRDKLIAKISNNLSIEHEVHSLLRISYEDSIPQRAKDILTQVVLSYEKYDLRVRQIKDLKNIKFLNKMIIELENNLKEIGNKIKKYKLKHNELLILGSEDKIFTNTIERNRQIDLLSLKLDALKTTKERIEKGIYSISILENSNLQTTDINQLIEKLREKNEYVTRLYQQKNDLDTTLIKDLAYTNLLKKFKSSKEKLLELTVTYTDEYPEVKKIRIDINLLQSELESYLQKNINKSNAEIINLKQEIYKTIKILINSINQEYATVKKSLKKDAIKIEKLPNSTMQLEELKRTFKVNEKNYEKLLQKRSESLISKESTISNIQIIDTATLPTSPIKPKKNFLFLSGLILGIILSIFYTSIKINKNRNIYSKYDINAKNYSLIYEENNLEKSFWTLITHIEKSIPIKKSKILLVSASDYGENKSLTVLNLSVKLSKISKKVLVIDFDVYHPNLTKGLNQNLFIGLSTLLTSKHSLEEIDVSIYLNSINHNKEYKNIDILSSGPTIPNGSALLFNSKVLPLIEILSKQYDYILIDAPPLGKYPEINILLNYVNIFLVVVKMGKTDKYFFDKLHNREEKDIEKIIFLT